MCAERVQGNLKQAFVLPYTQWKKYKCRVTVLMTHIHTVAPTATHKNAANLGGRSLCEVFPPPPFFFLSAKWSSMPHPHMHAAIIAQSGTRHPIWVNMPETTRNKKCTALGVLARIVTNSKPGKKKKSRISKSQITHMSSYLPSFFSSHAHCQ